MLILTNGAFDLNSLSLTSFDIFVYSAGDLNSDELERLVTIIQNPTQFKIPTWFLNRQKDIIDGKNSQILSNGVDSKLRDDLERLKKIRAHRGLRHYWGLRVRGQHTKTTGKVFRNRNPAHFITFDRSPRQNCWCVEETRLEGRNLIFYYPFHVYLHLRLALLDNAIA